MLNSQLDIEKTVWLWVGPKGKLGSKHLMHEYMLKVLIPTALQRRAHVIQLMTAPPWKTQEAPEHTSSAAQAVPDPKIVLTQSLDGEHEQMAAIMSALLSSHPDAKCFRAIKLAAATSKIQQPCDVSPCFKITKWISKNRSHRYDDVIRPWCMDKVEQLLAPLEADARAKYILFMHRLPGILSSAFTHAHIVEGWVVSGMWPLSPLRMLQQCSTFKHYTAQESEVLLAAVRPLAVKIVENGELEDEDFAEATEGTVDFVLVGRDATTVTAFQTTDEAHTTAQKAAQPSPSIGVVSPQNCCTAQGEAGPGGQEARRERATCEEQRWRSPTRSSAQAQATSIDHRLDQQNKQEEGQSHHCCRGALHAAPRVS